MHRCTFSLFLTLGLFCGIAALAQQPTRGLRDVVDPSQAPPPPPVVVPDTLDAGPKSLSERTGAASLVRRVAQLMMVTLEGGAGPNSSDRQFIKDFPPGAVIVPRVTSPEAGALYVTALRSVGAGRIGGVPLLIGADILTVSRFRERLEPFYLPIPSMLTLAAAGESDATLNLFRVLGEDMKTMGFHFHLGPPLTLASSMGENPDKIYNFGAQPKLTAALSRQFGQAMRENDLLWMPLDFPGGGENREARGPAVLLTPKSRLRGRDLLPFEAAIAEGVQLMNVGDTLVPTLDTSKPAALSSIVNKELLVNIMNYNGLVIAGPMDAPELATRYDTSRAAVEALLAGADMLYWNQAGQHVIKAIGTIVQGIEKGALPEALIDRAYQRILSLKDDQGLAERAMPDAKAAKKLSKKRRKLQEPLEIERRAITLVKNTGQVLPLDETLSQPIGVTGTYGVEELHDALVEYIEPIGQQLIRTARHLTRIEDFEIDRLTKRSGRARTIICVFSDNIELRGQLDVVRIFQSHGQQVVVVLVGYPRNVKAFEIADAIVVAYGSVHSLDTTMRAVADVLVGAAPIDILPPLRPLDMQAGESITFDVHDVIRSPVGRLPVGFAPPFVAGSGISYRPTLGLERINWDFGDGTRARDPIVEHAFKKAGRYVVTLTVEGDTYDAASGAFTVIVR